MRKISPTDVKADFDSSINSLTAFYNTVKSQLTLDKDQSFLVENIALTAATFWEGFVHDLFVAYINCDSTQFVTHLQNAFEANRTAKQKLIADNFVQLKFAKHLSMSMITSLLDNNGNNVTFPNYGAMKDGATKYLEASNAAKIKGLTSLQGATINLWLALRNHIAHRSERSGKAMNEALQNGGLYGSPLQRGAGTKGVKHVGAYLKATGASSTLPRVEIILTSMQTIATAL
ncbi:HEPN domain-containing protein [Gluconobacter cerinus]|uniref:HEPN domain-containing protein n=1 Tax=Gluconobacter cerinus TaxID=38307 RepID=UPI001B8C5B55|nr:HEPN domain-containing protein [Gluconobacter cerinus]MBS0983382.1 hypothetical protein [Gluconobacter cerinus]